jgi:hypothetical protein
MIRLTEQRQTAPYVWVHPDESDSGGGLERRTLFEF